MTQKRETLQYITKAVFYYPATKVKPQKLKNIRSTSNFYYFCYVFDSNYNTTTITKKNSAQAIDSHKNDLLRPYCPKNKVRVITATSLFDGHDVAINIMRRILQNTHCEVIHLGHNRSVEEVVNAAIQEDVHAVAITCYQGGHNEYFKYVYHLLKEKGAGHIKIFGGGGGVILPDEIKALMDHGITRIYSPDDGRKMGLQGMVNDLVQQSDYPIGDKLIDPKNDISPKNPLAIARLISATENFHTHHIATLKAIYQQAKRHVVPVIGVTGTGGSGKSSIVDEIVRRFMLDFDDKHVGILSVDPTKQKTGGALLGDRLRMNAIHHPGVYMRSLATRNSNQALSVHVKDALAILKAARYDLIILETSGIGQGDLEITNYSDITLYVMTPDYGAPTQLEKINMLDFADLVVMNKSDKQGAKDALRDVKKQYQRNHELWDNDLSSMPVFDTIASQFNNASTNRLYQKLLTLLTKKTGWRWTPSLLDDDKSPTASIIPQHRVQYLSEIAEQNRRHRKWVAEQTEIAQQLYVLQKTKEILTADTSHDNTKAIATIQSQHEGVERRLSEENRKLLDQWESKKQQYKNDVFTFKVRNKTLAIKTHTESLAYTQVPKVALPNHMAWGEQLHWMLLENVPGEFPYTAGIYPFKREGEDPTRMFAGEGNPERTNRRFHYLSIDTATKRLSTAFDSVTLYGNNPNSRPDIYGKIGNSGVSVCCLDDMKKLYSGFNLADSKTSVSMTINGPAPILLAYFMNTAVDQQCELYIRQQGMLEEVEKKIATWYKDTERPSYRRALPEGNNGLGLKLLGVTGDQVLPREVYERIKKDSLAQVRGTVQADILKEDQAQNTCIFSIEFSLRLMGDIQQYFIKNSIKNFYSASISGYHIAEAGANPITQLAFTLANGFTYVEYFLSRGMHIDDFAPNLSFFFSNGIDPEYAVIGRVARRIWANAMKYLYKANKRSQMLKYHIQTSGRSLHAQEISFNDIRTTLQALYAVYDNCNSLHTNAYDEAVTTPTEESVRRAMAIQLIINKELGLAKNENVLQGSFIIQELTDLVETAVLMEFDRITARGGVIGAMETMYQRGKIQEESLHYETLKHTGAYPIIGVNTFLDRQGSPSIIPQEVIRATEDEKEHQIDELNRLHRFRKKEAFEQIKTIQEAARSKENIFEVLMQASKVCSLGQITNTLFRVGGEYRRSM